MPFAQQNETETKLKRNSFKTVSFQFYFSSISLCGGIRVYCVVLSLRTLNISLYLFVSIYIQGGPKTSHYGVIANSYYTRQRRSIFSSNISARSVKISIETQYSTNDVTSSITALEAAI